MQVLGELHLEIIVDRLMREFKSKQMSARLRLHIKKHLQNRSKLTVNMQNSPVVVVSMVIVKLNLHRWIQMVKKHSSLNLQLSAGAIPKEYIPAVGEGIEEAAKPVCLADSLYSVSMQMFMTVPIMKSTHLKWHSTLRFFGI